MIEPYPPGTVLAGKYEVERTLGHGGMGIVLAARRQHLDDLVAVKVLLPGHTRRADVVTRFVREGRAAAKLRSERVARVFDVDTLADGTPYMVMELLEGQTLEDALAASGRLPVERTIEYVLEACEALAEAHAIGIVHRDLKPSNLFLVTGPEGTPSVKLLDFGISKMRDSTDAAPLTSAEALIGSPGYMSPEQIANPSSVDARTDLWALGVMLYELVAGTRPFEGEGISALLIKIVSEPAPDLRARVPDAPLALAEAIARCLQKRVDDRFSSIEQLASALAGLGGPEAARSIARIRRTEETARKTSASRLETAFTPPAQILGAKTPSPQATASPSPGMPTEVQPAEPASASQSRSGESESSPGRPRSAIDQRSSQTLMATLKGHHLTIKLTAKQIGAALDAQDKSTATSLMKRLAELIDTHVRLEDARLYPELQHLAEQTSDADMVDLVQDFSSGMSEIGAVLSGYFEQYGDAKDLVGAAAEWPEVCDALFSRISAEEVSLYPLHRDLATAQKGK